MMQYVFINYTIGMYHEELIAHVACIGHYPLILRIP
jgi:hypothetical protein